MHFCFVKPLIKSLSLASMFVLNISHLASRCLVLWSSERQPGVWFTDVSYFRSLEGHRLDCIGLTNASNESFYRRVVACPLFVKCLPVNIDECLAVHAVDVEDSIQVIHLVLEDSSWPTTGSPRNVFTLLVQTCKGNVRVNKSIKMFPFLHVRQRLSDYRHWKQTRTRHFHRQVAWNCSRVARDALTCLLKQHSPSVQDPQVRIYKDPQRLRRKTSDLPRYRWTLFQHLFWVFQGQNPEWHTDLRGTQSHAVQFTHHFHHSVDDLLDFSAPNSCRVNGGCMWAQHRVPYLAHVFVWRRGRGDNLVFHILKIGAHLDAAGVRAAAVCMQVGRDMWKRAPSPSTAGGIFGCTNS